MISIDNLKLIQDTYRNKTHVLNMVDFVKNGGFFNKKSLRQFNGSTKLIEIARITNDNSLYLHDGLHRVSAMWLAGREEIRADEYYIVNRTYEMYMTPNFDMDYFTPFDIRVESRGDIGKFKERVREILKEYGEDFALSYIEMYSQDYITKKKHNSIKELVNDTFRNSRSN